MEKRQKKGVEKFALTVTHWVGSFNSILLHTFIFVGSFAAVWFDILPFDRMLLVLTTVLSLEAIYLSIFIQMSINLTSATIEEVGHDIDEIQEDIGEIQEDVGEIQEDVDEIQEDVDEIQEDVDELQEDVEEMSEEDKVEDAKHVTQEKTLQEIRSGLEKLMIDIEKLQKRS